MKLELTPEEFEYLRKKLEISARHESAAGRKSPAITIFAKLAVHAR